MLDRNPQPRRQGVAGDSPIAKADGPGCLQMPAAAGAPDAFLMVPGENGHVFRVQREVVPDSLRYELKALGGVAVHGIWVHWGFVAVVLTHDEQDDNRRNRDLYGSNSRIAAVDFPSLGTSRQNRSASARVTSAR